MAENMR